MTLPLEHRGAPLCVPPQIQVHMGIGDASVSETGKGQESKKSKEEAIQVWRFLLSSIETCKASMANAFAVVAAWSAAALTSLQIVTFTLAGCHEMEPK